MRFDYSHAEIEDIYDQPLTRLCHQAQTIHANSHPDDAVQLCSLLSIKTGGCREDCGYCPQSAHHDTELAPSPLLDVEAIIAQAKSAKQSGATRFCMGAAWRSPPEREKIFQQLLDIASAVDALGMQVCMTLGMLTAEQAQRLKAAGVYAYNHNLDTSPEYYPQVISTRTYEDRLQTLKHVRAAGMTVCCGGIIGMGEKKSDRISLLQQLSMMNPHPESVPINLLVRVAGTPFADKPSIDIFELIRTVATARVIMPRSKVRLSAGRTEMSDEAQAMCFVAGANSIFTGEKLLTTENPETSKDMNLLRRLGLKALQS